MATTRPRGFINWSPSNTIRKNSFGESMHSHSPAEIVEAVQGILEDSFDILPLTLRQIFYMMVSNHAYEKTEQAYSRLCETMNKARRAQIVDMDDIRDDGLTELHTHGWGSERALIHHFKRGAEQFTLDRQDSQEKKLIVWCEAGGMAPQLESAVSEYHIPVLSSGGFDSVTTKHNMAKRISDLEDVEILHIGDHDPSGVHLYYSLDEDLQAFLLDFGGDVEMTRLAVTPDQVEEMGLPTAPPKKTDNRSFEGKTTQAEAIPPRTLRQIVQDAVEDRIDHEAYQAVLAEEKEIRARLVERLEDL